MNDNKSAFSSSAYDRKIKQTLPYYDEFDVITAIQVDHYLHMDERKIALKHI